MKLISKAMVLNLTGSTAAEWTDLTRKRPNPPAGETDAPYFSPPTLLGTKLSKGKVYVLDFTQLFPVLISQVLKNHGIDRALIRPISTILLLSVTPPLPGPKTATNPRPQKISSDAPWILPDEKSESSRAQYFLCIGLGSKPETFFAVLKRTARKEEALAGLEVNVRKWGEFKPENQLGSVTKRLRSKEYPGRLEINLNTLCGEITRRLKHLGAL